RQRAAIAPDQSDGMEGGTQGLALHRVRYYRQPHLRQQLYQGWLPALQAGVSMGVAQYVVLAEIPQELATHLSRIWALHICRLDNPPGGQTATGFFCFSEVLCKAADRRHLWTC